MYFSLVPNIEYPIKPIGYPFTESDIAVAKNFFRRYQLNPNIFESAVFFNLYSIEETERPEHVAQKFYGDPLYDWVVLLSNNIINAQFGWPLTNAELVKLVESEYDDPYGTIHHYETYEYGQYPAGLRVDESFYNSTHKFLFSDGVYVEKDGNQISKPVTVMEHFTTENEKKREIFILKYEYFQSFVSDFRNKNKYKKSDDYVSSKLKKARL
jgi:hypothetical protein